MIPRGQIRGKCLEIGGSGFEQGDPNFTYSTRINFPMTSIHPSRCPVDRSIDRYDVYRRKRRQAEKFHPFSQVRIHASFPPKGGATTTGRINMLPCNYFKILRRVYAAIRRASRDGTYSRDVQSLSSLSFSFFHFEVASPLRNWTVERRGRGGRQEGRYKLSQLRACQPL